MTKLFYLKKMILFFSLIFLSSAILSQQGFKCLFDGKTLNGWKRVVSAGQYSVKDNMIVGTSVANSPYTFLATEKNYGDFILEFYAKVDDTSSNSGVQLRSHF